MRDKPTPIIPESEQIDIEKEKIYKDICEYFKLEEVAASHLREIIERATAEEIINLDDNFDEFQGDVEDNSIVDAYEEENEENIFYRVGVAFNVEEKGKIISSWRRQLSQVGNGEYMELIVSFSHECAKIRVECRRIACH